MKKTLLALAAVLLVASCNNSKKQQTEEQTPAAQQTEIQQPEAQQPQQEAQIQEPDVAVADVVGYYDSFNQEGGNEERISLNDDGTATWNMIGSLHFTEFLYKIKGKRIFFTAMDDNSEAGYYDYDPEKNTLTSEGGTVYFLQK